MEHTRSGRSTSTAELGLAGDDALTNSDTWDVRWPGGVSHIVYERNGELRVHTIDAGCRDPSPVRRRTTARRRGRRRRSRPRNACSMRDMRGIDEAIRVQFALDPVFRAM